jgi:hypothetical protein
MTLTAWDATILAAELISLDHHGRDAREHGLGHRGRQHVGDRVQPVHLLLIGYALTKPDVRVVATEDVLAWMRANMSRKL